MIKEIIQSVLPMSKASQALIENLVECVEFETGDTFIQENKPNNKEYFVIEGVCRSYVLSPEGEEITISLFTNGSVLSPYMTRTIQSRSNMNFQALSPLTLGMMDASKFENLMVENLEVREFGNTVLRNELKLKVEKELGMASSTAKERLLKFRERYPLLENLIPHTTIATYLGITNISLSRLRRELMGK